MTTLPLYERINLLVKELTRYRQTRVDDVALVELTTKLYALAKDVEEKGAHTTYHVELAVYSVLLDSPFTRELGHGAHTALGFYVTQRLKEYEEVRK